MLLFNVGGLCVRVVLMVSVLCCFHGEFSRWFSVVDFKQLING